MKTFTAIKKIEKTEKTEKTEKIKEIIPSFFITIVVFFVFSNAFAKDGSESIGRHIHTSHKALSSHSSQRDLLSQTIQIRFPKNINTVGAAIAYLLRDSGYSLVSENKISSSLKNTLQKPLPVVDRVLGSIPLREALVLLVGPAFTLAEDPLNREVDFHVKPNFSKKTSQETGLWGGII
jgi:type IV pili sensor histidine kinase/response regulator